MPRTLKFNRGQRVELTNLQSSPQLILDETGYADVVAGLKGVVTCTRVDDNPGYIEVKLDRAGEYLAFRRSELIPIKEA